jgi:hypothetical protein
VDVVVIYDWTRLGRKDSVSATIREGLEEAEVRLCVNGQVYEPTSEAMFMGTVFTGAGTLDRRKSVARMAQAQHELAQVGGWPGGPPPFGIRLEYPPRPDGGKPKPVAVVDEHEAEVIKTAYRLIATEGRSTWQAAAELNALGLLPRRSPRWVHNTLRRTLMKPSLMGVMSWGKPPGPNNRKPPEGGKSHRGTGKHGEHPVRIPAVLTPDEFGRLQAALATSTTPAPAKASAYLLSGRGHQHLLMPCGAAAHGAWDRRPGRGRTYRCWNRRPESPEQCGCFRLDAEQVEWWVRVSVLGLLQNPDLMSGAMRAWLSDVSDSSAAAEQPDELDRRIAALERKRTNLVLAAAEVGPEAIAEAVRAVEDDLAALRGRREEMVLASAEAAEPQARLAELPDLGREAMGWGPQEWRAFVARWGIHVHVVRWLTGAEMALRSPLGEPPPMPFVARIEGLWPRAHNDQGLRYWTCCRPPTPVTAAS